MTTSSTCTLLGNQKEQNSCMIAQEVGQLCNSGYTVPWTNFQESNFVPNTTTANACTCCWSIYNLLSACSYCYGQTQYTSWSAWTTECGNYASNNSYLPSGSSFSWGIPYWAATNPANWPNGVFDVTQAVNVADEGNADEYGGPSPASTTTTTSQATSSSPTGAIVGGVVGGVAFVLVVGVLLLWMVRRHRRRRMHTDSPGIPSSSTSQPIIGSSVWGTSGDARAPYATITPYVASPVHSTTSLALTSLVSPVSQGFPSDAVRPIDDSADIIAPFLSTSSSRPLGRANPSLPTGKAAEGLSERATTPTNQRARLNPPSYSASVEEESVAAATRPHGLTTRKPKKREGSVSGTTTLSGISGVSSEESARTGSRTVQNRSHTGTGVGRGAESGVSARAGGTGSGIDSKVEKAYGKPGKRGGASDRRQPEV